MSLLIKSNVDLAEKAQVFVFLVNHSNPSHLEFVRTTLNQFQPNKEDLLLVEDPDSLDKWDFSFRKESWEEPEILKQVLAKKTHFFALKKIIEGIPDLSKPKDLKIKAIKQLMQLDRKMNKDNLESLETYLNHPSFFLSELGEIQTLFSSIWNRVWNDFQEEIVMKTFSARQTHLIKKIHQNLGSHRVFLLCGSSHGNVETSFLPTEAQRLVNYLTKNSKFIIYSQE